MDTISKNLTTAILAVIVIAGCIYAGQVEHNDAVSSGMSLEKYQYIHDRLGGLASERDIVKEYLANQEYYNSINY